MAKVNVTSLVHYHLTDPWLLVSVEEVDGSPAAGLLQADFSVGLLASLNHIYWEALAIIRFTEQTNGYYSIQISPPPSAPTWASSDYVMTVAVKTATKQGQALACNSCCSKGGQG